MCNCDVITSDPPAAEEKQNAADMELKRKTKKLLNLCSESGLIEREKFQSGADEKLSEGRKKEAETSEEAEEREKLTKGDRKFLRGSYFRPF